MPGTFNLPDDSKVALSAHVVDRGGFVDSNAIESWATSDPNVAALDVDAGTDVVLSSVGGPGTSATVSLAIVDATGAVINGPDGNPLGDSIIVTVVSSADVQTGIVPGAVTPK